MATIDLRSLPLEELTEQLKTRGYPAFRAKQIREWLDRGITDFDHMTNLPKELRQTLAEIYTVLICFSVDKVPSQSGKAIHVPTESQLFFSIHK